MDQEGAQMHGETEVSEVGFTWQDQQVACREKATAGLKDGQCKQTANDVQSECKCVCLSEHKHDDHNHR